MLDHGSIYYKLKIPFITKQNLKTGSLKIVIITYVRPIAYSRICPVIKYHVFIVKKMVLYV